MTSGMPQAPPQTAILIHFHAIDKQISEVVHRKATQWFCRRYCCFSLQQVEPLAWSVRESLALLDCRRFGAARTLESWCCPPGVTQPRSIQQSFLKTRVRMGLLSDW